MIIFMDATAIEINKKILSTVRMTQQHWFIKKNNNNINLSCLGNEVSLFRIFKTESFY